MTSPNQQDDALRTKLNMETSHIAWKDLLRFFAAGTVINVSENLDLIEAAIHISNDNKTQVEQWMVDQQIYSVTDTQAKDWLESEAVLWAVVIRPWILVQPVNDQTNQARSSFILSGQA